MILTNKNEKRVVKEIHKKMKEFIKECPPNEVSSTFIPYYDSIIDE
jgi:hypothetical protein